MSIRDLNKYLKITDLVTNEIEVIHDYYKLNDYDLRTKYLFCFINKYIENEIPFKIDVGYKN